MLPTGYTDRVGTSTGETLTASDHQVVFGLGGNDTLIHGGGATWLIGGSGDDTYRVQGYGITAIYDAGGSANDHFYESSNFVGQSYAAQIDGRHLVVLDLSGNGILFFDWLTPTHKIEHFHVSGLDLSAEQYNGFLQASPFYLGSVPIDFILPGAGPTIDATLAELSARSAAYTAAATATFGTEGNDVISGSSGDDRISGLGGNDTINGGSGSDVIYGNAGSDVLSGAAGNDWLYGGMGTDLLYGGDGADFVYGNNDNDTIYGGAGNDWIHGGMESDLIFGEAGNDTIRGGIDNDSLSGGTGNDALAGGAGADQFFFRSLEGQDTIEDFNRSDGDKIVLTSISGITQSNVTSFLQNNGTGTVTLSLPGGQASIGGGVTNRIVITNVSGGALTSSDFIVIAPPPPPPPTTRTGSTLRSAIAAPASGDHVASQHDVLVDPQDGTLVELVGVAAPDRDGIIH
jgi:Ca2+-binding RTX toxin-like protein